MTLWQETKENFKGHPIRAALMWVALLVMFPIYLLCRGGETLAEQIDDVSGQLHKWAWPERYERRMPRRSGK